MQSREEATAALTGLGQRVGLVMDCDGVLSPITADPRESQLIDGAAPVLAQLARKLPVVALLSGRPVSFLADRAGIDGVTLVGSYGLETWQAGAAVALPAAAAWRAALESATARLRTALAGEPGTVLEEKSLAVAVHWRTSTAQGVEERVAGLVAAVALETGLLVEPGKMVHELRPPLKEDKGTALTRLIEAHALDRVGYAGDDRGDLPAFAVARASGGLALVVLGDETAPEVAAVPGVVFGGPADFLGWLRQLCEVLG